MKTRIQQIAFTLGLLVLLVGPGVPLGPVRLHAQAAITPTTTTGAMTSSQTTVTVTSATPFAANYTAVIDNEAMNVLSVSGLTITVRRGASGTAAFAHASGAVVFGAPSNQISAVDPVGACTSTAEIALPRIVISRSTAPAAVSIYDCLGKTATTQRWQIYQKEGYLANTVTVPGAPTNLPVTYTAAGAITVQPGLVFISCAAACNMTLADPSVVQEGMIMTIVAQNAVAHKVISASGFNVFTLVRTQANYGGSIGDNMLIYAHASAWWVLSVRNVTFA